jgi:hypothetical protein
VIIVIHWLLIQFFMATKVHNNGIQDNVFSVYEKNASEFESTGHCTTRTEKLQIFFFLNLVYCVES